ncbi:rhodanese-like domain-containing protein [Thermosynechococcus sp. HN-54]|uniref:rhodanese-like domain-containing protein n=1 Tax=Thermosynechococcus sp. HN-54 TaxID=2933959 RepID=UPI00202CF1BF|nr:rhodanese-like domain-containing protein [Thermosynechococcus sp. HN-54]URR35132.1 rhodanese-like domain-containing protein [Thermosynechococcus sp. HN-54]
MTVKELAARLATEVETLQLIDVREPAEWDIVHLPPFTLLPLSEFPQWSPQIRQLFDPDRETLVLCHHGVRSAQMGYWLIQQGFRNVKNIVGGIDAYAAAVDPSLPRY